MTTRLVALGEVCSFVGGGTPSRKAPAYFKGEIPWATVKDFKSFTINDTEEHITEQALEDSASNLVQPGAVLLVTRVGLGKVAIAGTRLAINQDVKAVLPNSDEIQPEYLFWFLLSQAKRIQAMGTGATVKGVTLNDMRAIRIPLPPLPEQRRPVDLLSRAEGIVRLRREAQAKTAELIPALFLEMFGDPASNPKGWPVVELGEYLAIPSSVKMPDLEVEGDIHCIGADSIESGTGKIVSWPTVGDIRPISGKYHFEKDDVLYSKIRPALRKAILAPSDGYCSADMYPLRPTQDRATPEFVVALLLSKDFTDYAIGVSMRAQMPKVNRETLFAYKAPLPPIDLQRQFACKVEAVRAIAAQQSDALATAQATFEALLHQLFASSHPG